MVQNGLLNVPDDLDEPPVVFDPADPNSQIQQPAAGGDQRTRTGAELDNMNRPDFGGGVNSSLVRGGDGASPVAQSETHHMGAMVDGEFVPGAQPETQEPRPITLLPSAQNPPVEQEPRPVTLLPSAQNTPAADTQQQALDPSSPGSQIDPNDERPLWSISSSELVPDGGGNLSALWSRFNKRKQEMLGSGQQWTQEGSQVPTPNPDYTPTTNYRPDRVILGGGWSGNLYNKVADIQGNPRSEAHTDSKGNFHPGRDDVNATLREAERRGHSTSGGRNRQSSTSGPSAAPGAQGAKKTGEYTGLPAPSSMDEWNDRSSIHQVDEDGDFVLDLDGNLITTDFGHEVQARRDANEAGINARLDDAAYRYNRQALREGREPTAKPGQYTPARMDRLNAKRARRKLGYNASKKLNQKYGEGAATEAAAMEGGIAEYTRRKANEQRGDVEAIDNRLERDKLGSAEKINRQDNRQRELQSQRDFDSHAADRSSLDAQHAATLASTENQSQRDFESRAADRSSLDSQHAATLASTERQQQSSLDNEREIQAENRADRLAAEYKASPLGQLEAVNKLDDAKWATLNPDQQTEVTGAHMFGKDAPTGKDRSNGARTWVRSHGLSAESTAGEVHEAAVDGYGKARNDADRLRIAKHALTTSRVLGNTRSDFFYDGFWSDKGDSHVNDAFQNGSQLTSDEDILNWAKDNLQDKRWSREPSHSMVVEGLY
jgi:hypothetical protein